MKKYDLSCASDVSQHKKAYHNYLEVIIDRNGKVMYAIPSHQEKLIEILCSQRNQTRKQVFDSCPKEYYFDFLKWLCMETGCCSAWDGFVYGDKFSDDQISALAMLKRENVYHGKLPNKSECL